MSTEISILFEDEHVLVVDKPARTLVVPAAQRRGPTVVERIGAQTGARVHAVHRLDEDTTGVLVLARTLESKRALEAAFRAHDPERIYLALCAHAPSPPAGRLESRLREGADGVMRSVTGGSGERAVTYYRTLRRCGRLTLVECRLETGRRNQIRAHLAEFGCPIAGDRKYGWRARGDGGPKRPLLHALRVVFAHPATNAKVDVRAEPPADFAAHAGPA